MGDAHHLLPAGHEQAHQGDKHTRNAYGFVEEQRHRIAATVGGDKRFDLIAEIIRNRRAAVVDDKEGRGPQHPLEEAARMGAGLYGRKGPSCHRTSRRPDHGVADTWFIRRRGKGWHASYEHDDRGCLSLLHG